MRTIVLTIPSIKTMLSCAAIATTCSVITGVIVHNNMSANHASVVEHNREQHELNFGARVASIKSCIEQYRWDYSKQLIMGCPNRNDLGV